MISIKSLEPTIKDQRGFLYEIIEAKIGQVNFLFSKAGTVRGNHYHKKLKETFFVVSGEFILETYDLRTKSSHSYTVKKGDYFEIPTYTNHTLKFNLDTKIIVTYSEKFDPSCPDIFKL